MTTSSLELGLQTLLRESRSRAFIEVKIAIQLARFRIAFDVAQVYTARKYAVIRACFFKVP